MIEEIYACFSLLKVTVKDLLYVAVDLLQALPRGWRIILHGYVKKYIYAFTSSYLVNQDFF